MTPPINIDGTNENYSNVTIDGQDVTQITIDGQDVLSAIPDSAVANYDPKDQSTGATTTVPNTLSNSFDLSGNTDVVSSGINGIQSYSFDGSEHVHTSTTLADTEPFVVVAVAEIQQSSFGTNNTLLDGGQRHGLSINDNASSAFSIGRGGSPTNAAQGLDANPHVYELIADNTDQIEVKIDGVNAGGPNTASTSDLTGLTLATFGDEDTNNEMDCLIGEVTVLEAPSQSEIADERQRLANEYNISI